MRVTHPGHLTVQFGLYGGQVQGVALSLPGDGDQEGEDEEENCVGVQIDILTC